MDSLFSTLETILLFAAVGVVSTLGWCVWFAYWLLTNVTISF